MTAKPPAKPSDAAAFIDLIVQNAARLHGAGVTSMRIGDCEVVLAAPPPAAPDKAAAPRAQRAPHIDPLRDPSTYPGGRVPGFTRDDDRDEEQPGGRRTFE